MTDEVDSRPTADLSAYVELTKPRILTMVLITTTLGFALGGQGIHFYDILIYTLFGTALCSGGAGVLNHYIEREVDLQMDRTRNRPIPTGKVDPGVALVYGLLLSIGGTVILYVLVNPLAAILASTTVLLYALIYTPFKRVSWLNTPVGAIPGAIPPMIGWAAATGGLELGAWILFAILFLWQHPHFYAIAWMFREDYRKGGFKMLPVVKPDGKDTFRQSLASCILLIPVSLLPTLIHMTGWLYFVGALLIGLGFLASCVRWRISTTTIDARKVLMASVMYLPALLLLILVDSFVQGWLPR